MWLFEQLCALWDCFAGDHRHCAVNETVVSMGRYSASTFICPVASAFLQAGLALGIGAEPLGAWPSFRRSFSAWNVDRSVPAWAFPLIAREQLRVLVVDALEHLGEVAKHGWTEALWPFEAVVERVKVSSTSSGLYISGATSDTELRRACEAAATTCRNPRQAVA